MKRKAPQSDSVGAQRMADGYQHASMAADVLFGAFVALVVAVSVISWLGGQTPGRDALALLGFMISNATFGVVGRKGSNQYATEAGRMVVGGIFASLAHVFVSGALALSMAVRFCTGAAA